MCVCVLYIPWVCAYWTLLFACGRIRSHVLYLLHCICSVVLSQLMACTFMFCCLLVLTHQYKSSCIKGPLVPPTFLFFSLSLCTSFCPSQAPPVPLSPSSLFTYTPHAQPCTFPSHLSLPLHLPLPPTLLSRHRPSRPRLSKPMCPWASASFLLKRLNTTKGCSSAPSPVWTTGTASPPKPALVPLSLSMASSVRQWTLIGSDILCEANRFYYVNIFSCLPLSLELYRQRGYQLGVHEPPFPCRVSCRIFPIISLLSSGTRNVDRTLRLDRILLHVLTTFVFLSLSPLLFFPGVTASMHWPMVSCLESLSLLASTRSRPVQDSFQPLSTRCLPLQTRPRYVHDALKIKHDTTRIFFFIERSSNFPPSCLLNFLRWIWSATLRYTVAKVIDVSKQDAYWETKHWHFFSQTGFSDAPLLSQEPGRRHQGQQVCCIRSNCLRNHLARHRTLLDRTRIVRPHQEYCRPRLQVLLPVLGRIALPDRVEQRRRHCAWVWKVAC